MRLVTRLFASIGLLVAAAVVGSIIAADVLLRRYLEQEIASDLAREARLIAAFAPALVALAFSIWTGMRPTASAAP